MKLRPGFFSRQKMKKNGGSALFLNYTPDKGRDAQT